MTTPDDALTDIGASSNVSPPAASSHLADDVACRHPSAGRNRTWLGRTRIRLGFGGRKSTSSRRLCAAISRFAVEVGDHQPDPESDQIRRYLLQARDAAERFDTESGWLALNAARRITFRGGEDARLAQAAAVKAEADQKLSGWRLKAVVELIGDASNSDLPSWEAIREAQFIIDENSANVYRRLDLYANSIGFIVVVLVAFLGLSILVVENDWLDELEGTSLADTDQLFGIMLLGAIGSILSVALTRVGGSGRPVPEMIENSFVDVLRPVLGAVSGVVLVLVLESGVQSTIDATGSKVYVWALLAGFSERLLRRTLESVAQSARGNTSGD